MPCTQHRGTDFYRLGAAGLEDSSPVYNMETPPNEPAELGFAVVDGEAIVHIIGKVRTGEDYGFAAEVPDVEQGVEFWSNTITIFGDPPTPSVPSSPFRPHAVDLSRRR